MEKPYRIECKKCNVQFYSETTNKKLCIICMRISKGEDIYPRVFYKNRKIVFERDEHCCQCCGCREDGQRTNGLIVHHIDCDKQNNSPSNLITLCGQCHLSLHGKYDRKTLRRSNVYRLFANEKQFGEFGKNLIYEPARKMVKKQFKGKPEFFFSVKKDGS